jgi:uncharacterized membrane protein
MKRVNPIVLIVAWICAIGLMLIAFLSLSVNAEQPPSERCIAVSRQEYYSADRQKLLHTQFSTYVRTGRLGRRNYWYCHS